MADKAAELSIVLRAKNEASKVVAGFGVDVVTAMVKATSSVAKYVAKLALLPVRLVAGAVGADKLANSIKNIGAGKISADMEKASASVREVDQAFQKLGVRTDREIKEQIRGLTSAFEEVKESGTATPEEIERAYRQMTEQVETLTNELENNQAEAADNTSSAWGAAIEGIRGHLALMITSIAATLASIETLRSGAEFDQTQEAFNRMAASFGADGDKIITKLKEVSAETIAQAELMRIAGTAMKLGIPAEELADLMEIARASARITGKTITEAFESAAFGIGRQSKMILDNLGIVFDVEKAYKDFATTLGKTSLQLTDAERKMAFLNAVMKSGNETVEVMNISQVSSKEIMQQWVAVTKDLVAEIGQKLLKAVDAIDVAFNAMAAGMQKVIAGILGLVGATEISNLIALKSEENWGRAKAAWDRLFSEKNKVEDYSDAVQLLGDTSDESMTQIKKKAEEAEKALDKAFQTLGVVRFSKKMKEAKEAVDLIKESKKATAAEIKLVDKAFEKMGETAKKAYDLVGQAAEEFEKKTREVEKARQDIGNAELDLLERRKDQMEDVAALEQGILSQYESLVATIDSEITAVEGRIASLSDEIKSVDQILTDLKFDIKLEGLSEADQNKEKIKQLGEEINNSLKTPGKDGAAALKELAKEGAALRRQFGDTKLGKEAFDLTTKAAEASRKKLKEVLDADKAYRDSLKAAQPETVRLINEEAETLRGVNDVIDDTVEKISAMKVDFDLDALSKATKEIDEAKKEWIEKLKDPIVQQIIIKYKEEGRFAPGISDGGSGGGDDESGGADGEGPSDSGDRFPGLPGVNGGAFDSPAPAVIQRDPAESTSSSTRKIEINVTVDGVIGPDDIGRHLRKVIRRGVKSVLKEEGV